VKDRLGIADWTAVVVNAAGGSVVALLGRAIQVLALAVLALVLWPTLAGIAGWLKFGTWVVPTPMSVSPEAARAVAASTDWVTVQDLLVWLAGHHVLWTGLPLAALVALVGQAFVSVGSTRRGRAGDIVSLSLRDEYILRESWARWRPRLVALIAFGFIAALGALAYIFISQ
jgi:hypothetical protein